MIYTRAPIKLLNVKKKDKYHFYHISTSYVAGLESEFVIHFLISYLYFCIVTNLPDRKNMCID